MGRQPGFDFGMLVRGVVIPGSSAGPGRRSLRVDQAQKFQPLLVPVPGLAFSDDLAVGPIVGRKESGRESLRNGVRHVEDRAFSRSKAVGNVELLKSNSWTPIAHRVTERTPRRGN